MAVEEPMEGKPAAAGNDAGGDGGEPVLGRQGTDRRDPVMRLRREMKIDFYRVRDTIRSQERDRIGAAGYVAIRLLRRRRSPRRLRRIDHAVSLLADTRLYRARRCG
jgi:hypothetical protein